MNGTSINSDTAIESNINSAPPDSRAKNKGDAEHVLPSCAPFTQAVKQRLSAMFSFLKRTVICGSEKYLDSDDVSSKRRSDSPTLRNLQIKSNEEAIKRNSLTIGNTPSKSETTIITVPISDKPVVTLQIIEKSGDNKIQTNENPIDGVTSSLSSPNSVSKQLLTTSSSTGQNAHSTRSKDEQVLHLLDDAKNAGQEGAEPLFRQALDLLKGIENPDPKLLTETIDRLMKVYEKTWRPELAPLFLDAVGMSDRVARKYDLLRDNPEYLDWGGSNSIDIERESEESCKKAREIYEFGGAMLKSYGEKWVSNTSDPLDVATAKLFKLTIDMAQRKADLLETYGESAVAETIQRFLCDILQKGLRSKHPEIQDKSFRYLPVSIRMLRTNLEFMRRTDEANALRKYEKIVRRIFHPNPSMYAETSMEQKRADYEEAVGKMRKFGYKVLDFAQLNIE